MTLIRKFKEHVPSQMKSIVRPLYWKMVASYHAPKGGLFTSTNIETYGHCNRKCSFCFNNDRFPNRHTGIMSTDIWGKTIEELSSINYTGRISPHHFGEPLLDKRLPELISLARKKCPQAEIHFSSNGDLLTENVLLELLEAGLDSILVTNYDDLENPNLVKLHNKYPSNIRYRNVKDMWLQNKAGAQLDRTSRHVNMPCLRPSRQLVIDWQGNVVLCCNDYYESHVFGNVKDKSILEIWNSEDFQQYRQLLRRGHRAEIDICENCDTD